MYFSVNIVTHNNEHTIYHCLKALLAQKYKRFSLLVIDNHSTDKTIHTVKSLKIPIILNSTNTGYASAHNQGIKNTSGRFILTLNPDVILHPEYLKHIYAYLRKADRDIGAVSGKLLRINSISERSNIIDSMGVFLRKNRRQGLLYENTHSDFSPKDVFPIFGPDGASAVYRREMLQDIAIKGDIFDSDFFLHKEDIDLCWRASLLGWRSVCIPQAVACHIRTFRPGSRKNIPQQIRTTAVRNRYYLLIKNDTSRDIIRDIFPIVLYEISIFIYIVLKEPRSLKAYKEVLINLSLLLQKRKIIQNRKHANIEIRQWFL